jgi:diguanylate cyclase (GGDEF)-like protein
MVEIAKHKPSILIIDDDEQIRRLLERLLSDDYECTAADSAGTALEVLDETNFSVVISDIDMPGMSGLELVPAVLKKNPDAVVIMISGQQTIDYAIEAMRVGAFDYITKPVDIRHVEAAVRRALSHHELREEKRRYENHLEDLVRERTREIEHLAFYDALTDLPNRTLFVRRSSEAIDQATITSKTLGLILISIDRFKNINDTLGHDAGDELLKKVGRRIGTCIRASATLARFDGPEFAILLTEKTDGQAAENVCAAIMDALKEPFHLSAQEVYVTPSIGVGLFPLDGDSVSRILQNAGAALYRAKQLGGNHYQFYRTEMNSLALNHMALEASLRRAVDNDEFVTYYQPVVDLQSKRIVGLEALVRWQHPQMGLLPPAEFLGLAEDTGLISDISTLVMRSACHQTRQWQLQGFSDLRIAVNVSARHFRQKDLFDRIRQILSHSGLGPNFLELELTETSIMENPESATQILTEIRRMGVRVAIDDFGTGYSSLAYLKRFPVDTLKLDRSFVSGVTTDRHDAALVTVMVTLAHNLNLGVVAEGIETNDQLDFLRLLKCDEGQGYLFSKPQPPEVIDRILGNETFLQLPDLGIGESTPIVPEHQSTF